MKKVLLVTDTWAPQVNGVVTTWKNLINYSDRQSLSFEILHPFLFKSFAWPFYKEIRLPLVSYKTIENKINKINPDYIHIATEGILGWHTRKYCNKKNIPFTTSYHTKFPEFLWSLYKIPKIISYKVIKKFHSTSSKILVNTSTMKKDLNSRGFNNLIEWTRGIDRNIFKPSFDKGLRKEIDPDNNKKIILFVGRVSKEKNINSFCKLSDKSNNYKFVIVGDGPIKESLKKAYPKIIFAGYKFGEELAKYYSIADCCVFPSLNDTFGNTIIESMACGTPVAAFPVNGPLDIIKKNKSGFIDNDLNIAIQKSLKINREEVVNSTEKYNWDLCFEIFINTIVRKN